MTNHTETPRRGRDWRQFPAGRQIAVVRGSPWIDKSNLPLFGADAVVEEGNGLTILSFRATQAQAMRTPGLDGTRWQLGDWTAFLSAWKSGRLETGLL